jgi:hypothetical protein
MKRRCPDCGLLMHAMMRDPEIEPIEIGPVIVLRFPRRPCDRIPIGGWPHKEAGWSRKQME